MQGISAILKEGLFIATHVYDEALRCLQCKNPQCVEGCPIRTPIPEMIKSFINGKIEEAGNTLYSNNPLSLICSLVCNHESQCEGHCVLGVKGQPVHISTIENYISDTCFERVETECAPKNGKMVAVIGAGPAGITIAVCLAQRGYNVTLFDAKDKIGGVLQYGIPDFRLPKTVLARYKKKLLEIGIHIRPNTTIGGALEIQSLFRDGYKSIFIGTGVWRPKTLGIKGESLGNVHFGIDYLSSPEQFNIGNKVSVIGAGNSAMDVARTAIRQGARKVTMYTHGTKSSASRHETTYAILDGATFEYAVKIEEITEDGPVIRRITYDNDNNVLEYSEELEQIYSDSTIIAISQGPKNKLVITTPGLIATKAGLLKTDGRGMTTVEGVFASGDVVLGAKNVVLAVENSKKVAAAMDEYMQNL